MGQRQRRRLTVGLLFLAWNHGRGDSPDWIISQPRPVFLPAVERIPTVVEYHGLRGWLRRPEPRGLCRWVPWRWQYELPLTTCPTGKPARTAMHGKHRGKCHIGDQFVPTHSPGDRHSSSSWTDRIVAAERVQALRSQAASQPGSSTNRVRQAATRMCRRPPVGIYQAPGCLVLRK